jgi:hypothetical protein
MSDEITICQLVFKTHKNNVFLTFDYRPAVQQHQNRKTNAVSSAMSGFGD